MPRKKGSHDKKPRKKRGGNKEGATQTAQAGLGHNSGDLTDEQQRALFLQNLGKVEKAKEVVDGAVSVLRHAYKTAKVDGITKKDIDFAIALRKNDDQEMVNHRRRELQIARWLSHPIGTQPDMFDDRPAAGDRAHELGVNAGMEGRPMKSPYDSGPNYHRWVEGYNHGQSVAQSVLKRTMEDNIKKAEEAAAAKPQAEAFSDALPDKEEGDDDGGEAEESTAETPAPADPVVPGPLSQQVANAKASDNGSQGE